LRHAAARSAAIPSPGHKEMLRVLQVLRHVIAPGRSSGSQFNGLESPVPRWSIRTMSRPNWKRRKSGRTSVASAAAPAPGPPSRTLQRGRDHDLEPDLAAGLSGPFFENAVRVGGRTKVGIGKDIFRVSLSQIGRNHRLHHDGRPKESQCSALTGGMLSCSAPTLSPV
jgi:hypothetical protein